MSKLYVFGIGGTGSRVLKSLTMLLASGVKCNYDIVPIIIDPDTSAADLTRSVDAMRKYNSIREKINFNSSIDNQFFATNINEDIPNFNFTLNNTKNIKFEDYMSVSTMSQSNQALMNMLFSKTNLDSDMKVGFKGNPNIGSVVLNQFEGSQCFQNFANNFMQGDKIFIISSIFGGTGASGFPLLAKLLRSNNRIPNFNIINNAQIGAITVLPYFNVEQDKKSAIDSGTFIAKTKAALAYYLNNISRTTTLDHLYYIGDKERESYENHEGGSNQKNKAHLVEMLSALAIIDFSFSNHKANPSQNTKTLHKEYGLKGGSEKLIFGDLGNETRSNIQVPLIQFMLFCNYFKQVSPNSYLTKKWAIENKIDKAFADSQFMKELLSFHQEFREWLQEMSDNTSSFSPFELENISKAFDIVKGEKAKNRLITIDSNYHLFDSYLNGCKKQATSKEQYLIELFYDSTKRLVDHKYNF